MNRLSGSVALVTGASSGIGEATALALATEGAAVAMAARRLDRLEALADRVSGTADGVQAFALECDLTDEAQAREAVERTVAELGRLDVLVNNAGLMLLGPILGAPSEEWRRMIDLNLVGLLACTHAALPHLLEAAANGPRRVADVVNVSSVAGRVARLGSGVYNATKFGVAAFSESLRQEAPAGTYACRSSSPARSRPNWRGTTVPRSSRPSGPTSRASSGCRRGTWPTRSSTR